MLLYGFAKLLFYLLLVFTGLILLVWREEPYIAALLPALIPACLLFYWLKNRLLLCANRQKPIIRVEATLVNHRQQFSGRGMRYEKSFLTFQLADGSALEFEVPRNEFERIQLGAKGPLEYRGSLYVSFRKTGQSSIKGDKS